MGRTDITGKQIKDLSIQTVDINDGAVTPVKLSFTVPPSVPNIINNGEILTILDNTQVTHSGQIYIKEGGQIYIQGSGVLSWVN